MKRALKIIGPMLMLAAAYQPCLAQGGRRAGNDDFRQNNVKLNIFALPLRTLSVQYERGFTEKISAALSLRLQPDGHIPLRSVFVSAFGITGEAGNDFADNARTSSFAATIEGRYYFGRRPLNGLYLAPFLRYNTYNIDWDYSFVDKNDKVVPVDISGKGKGFTGGLLIGAQWHIKERFLIDWWIVGPSYGRLNLSLTGSGGGIGDLDDEDRARLEYEVKSVTLGGSSFNADVQKNSITVTGSIPFPGVRTGLCVGYTF